MIIIKDNSELTINNITATKISSILNRSLGDLCKEQSNLLIFPQFLNQTHKDDIQNHYILSLEKKSSEESIIKTGNLMGFIGVNNTQLTICSRFSPIGDINSNNSEDYFLHYMLQKVFAINIFDFKHGYTHDNIFNFLPYLFPSFLKRAIKQGIFRQYRNEKLNNSQPKGAIDISRHINLNIPFNGKIAYNTRSFSIDNPITQLIRHTIEYISSKPDISNSLNCDKETIEAISLIRNSTPSYSKHSRQQIISNNLRQTRHPFYTEYFPLQKLCIQILNNEKIRYNNSKNLVYGILFDGAWLWEEYLNLIIQPLGFIHPENKTGKNSLYLFQGNKRKIYPDFYKKNGTILDAKYKGFYNYQINREDIFQMVSYMYIEKANHGGFVYPLCNKNILSVDIHEEGILNGYGGSVYLYGIPIPQEVANYAEFCSQMTIIESNFKNILLK